MRPPEPRGLASQKQGTGVEPGEERRRGLLASGMAIAGIDRCSVVVEVPARPHYAARTTEVKSTGACFGCLAVRPPRRVPRRESNPWISMMK